MAHGHAGVNALVCAGVSCVWTRPPSGCLTCGFVGARVVRPKKRHRVHRRLRHRRLPRRDKGISLRVLGVAISELNVDRLELPGEPRCG